VKILFFAPHSAIWVHAFPEALVAEALAQSGHEVVYVTCGESLQADCVAMRASGLDYRASIEQRQAVCSRCNANAGILRKRVGLAGYDMAAMLRAEDKSRVEEIVSGIGDADFLGLEIDGVPVGRYALYELLLHRKKGDLRLTADEWPEYRAALKSALTALFAGRRILDSEQPDRLVTYNSLYAVNRVLSRLAELRNIAPYFLHAGGNLSRRLQSLMIGRDYTFRFVKSLVAEWPRFRHRPCPPELIEQITAHFLVLFSGQSVFGYSSAADSGNVDLKAKYGIREDQRLLVATMSSPDERFAAQTIGALPPDEGLLFPTQLEWIQALVTFVSSRPDLFLLIRVHPREFPNKREGVRSQHAELLTRAFAMLPANTRVNWPSDGVALYDLANYTDVFLNSWSSAGKEMALLGIPVVAYAPDLMFYPSDLNYVGTTEAQFFATIDRALKDGWSIERSRAVYRWLAVEYAYGLVDISESYRQIEQSRPTVAGRFLNRLQAWADPNFAQKRDCRRRAATLKERRRIEQTLLLAAASTPLDERLAWGFPACDAAEEEVAVRASLVRIGQALFGSTPSSAHSGPLAKHLAALRQMKRAA